MYAVILAGGGGTRLWPVSRPDRPKPFLPLVDDRTLFQRTVDRIVPVVGTENVFAVAEARYAELVRSQATTARLIEEPFGRNTAAAIALATVAIERADDEVMVVLPADHWIDKVEVFQGVLRDAERELAHRGAGVEHPLVTMGIQHGNRPATGYGYLIPDLSSRQTKALDAYRLERFEEKPNVARAADLVRQPGVAWNAGIFMWERGAIRDALDTYTDLLPPLDVSVRSPPALVDAYEGITPRSIDYAVMEPAAAEGRVVMGAMDVGWSDLGSWTALLQAIAPARADGSSGAVLRTGEIVEAGPDDLLIRPVAGCLRVTDARGGEVVVDGPWAQLRAARHLEPEVVALLDRINRAEFAS